MVRRYRDTLDRDNPYWPRVRRIYTYLWAKGTLETGNGSIVLWSLLWMIFSLGGLLFYSAWRSGAILVIIFIIDRIIPGIVTCLFPVMIEVRFALFAASDCSLGDQAYLPLIALTAWIAIGLILVYPIRSLIKKVIDLTFVCLNILTLGYPLTIMAYLALQDATVAGEWLDRSYVIGPMSVGMVGILPLEYRSTIDHLWHVYHESETPAHQQGLEDLLEKLEAEIWP